MQLVIVSEAKRLINASKKFILTLIRLSDNQYVILMSAL